MRLDPIILPSNVTRLPFARSGKMSSDIPVITAGYNNPVSTVKTSVKRNPGPSSLIIISFLRQTQRDDELVNGPYAWERDNDSTEAIDEKIPAQHLSRANRFILHASQCERNQRNDDHRVENHGGEDGTLR